MMSDNKVNKEIIGDDYPTYEQYVNEYHSNKNMSTLHEKFPFHKAMLITENILTIANKLSEGQQVTITKDQYEISDGWGMIEKKDLTTDR